MEEFKEIYFRGYKFRVGSMGNIKYLNADKNRALFTNSSGYTAFSKGNKLFLVHRMVATAFIPNPENKPQVNHKNGIKSDNRVENLEWVTKIENEHHSIWVLGNKRNIEGLRRNWENPIHSKPVKVKFFDGSESFYKSQAECAKALNISCQLVSKIVVHKTQSKIFNIKSIENI